MSRSLRFAAIATLGGLCGLAAACEQDSERPAVSFSSPVARVPVGPLPGPTERPADMSNPIGAQNRSREEGRRFFLAYNCAGCHGDHAGGGMGPSLRDDAWLYGDSPAHIANSIAEGRAYGMPAWGRMLTDAQIWQLTAYISSLRTSEEPDPPVR